MVRNGSAHDTAEIIGRLEALIGRQHVSQQYVRFRIELLGAQTAVHDALAQSSDWPASAPADPATGDRTAALDPSEVPFDRGPLQGLLKDLAAALGPGDRRDEDLARLFAAAAKDPALTEQLARRSAFDAQGARLGELSQRLNVGLEPLLFVGRMLAAPAVTLAVARLKQQTTSAPKRSGGCPWCGSPPGLARLDRQHGRRVLCCSLCGESWEFGRLPCPFCGNQDGPEVLSFEPGDPRSIETCRQCKAYLKTLDERKLPDEETVVALVETTATLHLDLIAEQEGCARALPYAALR